MRVAVLTAFIVLCACAGNGLQRAPPPGVDFGGTWKLNEADSDDPLHLIQAANQPARPASRGSSGGGGQGSGRGSATGAGSPAFIGPTTPTMSALSEGLRWPGKRLEIKQVGGIVTFTSEGKSRTCPPPEAAMKPQHHSDSSDRDAPLPAARDAPPPKCGWLDKTLTVQNGDPDDDRPPFEERYSLSDDGQRLVELVGFKGGRYYGFTMSRVWDRVP
jgi:hypothetical protein